VSRRKSKRTRRTPVPIERRHAIVERTRTEPLSATEHATLKAAGPTPSPG
jgi:hypothetical protein